jgi:putative Holliday junction resolvase
VTDRVLGVDYGTKRLGLAVSSPEGTYALPLRTVEMENPNRAVAEVESVVSEEGVTTVVVGRPTHDGPGSSITSAVDAFVDALRRTLKVPVTTIDEAFTSAAAEMMLGNRRDRQGALDATSATLILQEYLSKRGSEDAKT